MGVHEVTLSLNNENIQVEAGVWIGSKFNGEDGKSDVIGLDIYDVPAEIQIVKADNLIIKIHVLLKSPLDKGCFLAAAVFNKKYHFYEYEGKSIKQFLTSFKGSKYSLALTVLGMGYTSMKNQYGIKLKDYDYRAGVQLCWASTMFNIVLDDRYDIEPEMLNNVLKKVKKPIDPKQQEILDRLLKRDSLNTL